MPQPDEIGRVDGRVDALGHQVDKNRDNIAGHKALLGQQQEQIRGLREDRTEDRQRLGDHATQLARHERWVQRLPIVVLGQIAAAGLALAAAIVSGGK